MDLDLKVQAEKCFSTDHLDDTLDYMLVRSWIETFTQKNTFKLIECLGKQIADLVLTNSTLVQEIRIKIRKFSVIPNADCVATQIRVQRG